MGRQVQNQALRQRVARVLFGFLRFHRTAVICAVSAAAALAFRFSLGLDNRHVLGPDQTPFDAGHAILAEDDEHPAPRDLVGVESRPVADAFQGRVDLGEPGFHFRRKLLDRIPLADQGIVFLREGVDLRRLVLRAHKPTHRTCAAAAGIQ